jgi:carbamoyltransferase
MITWGLVGNSHDASVAVFETKRKGLGPNETTSLVWAGLAKDFSGVPNDPHLNSEIIKHALDYGRPDKLVWYERPFLKTLRQLWAGQGWLYGENNIRRYLDIRGLRGIPLRYTQHHESHAAYAYYTQPHDNCAVICLDSIGEFETLTIWHGKNKQLKKIHSQGYPHSLGLFYSAMTQRLGLQAQRDEYLVAQWGAKGDKHRLFFDILAELVETRGMGVDPYMRMRENMHRGVSWWRPELTSQQDLYDIAAATQAVFEYCLVNIAAWTKTETKCKHLALAGGGALNRQAVALLTNWNAVHVPQNPGDPGSCVGAVLAQTKQRITLDNQWHKAV